MSFTIRTVKGKTVFQYEGQDGMVASWPFEDGTTDEALVAKLEGVLRFIRNQTDLAPAPPLPPASRPRGQVAVLGAAQTATHLPQYTPRTGPSLAASVAHAEANGWELYTGTEDD